VRTVAGECCCDDEEDEELDDRKCEGLIDGEKCPDWKTGDNGSSEKEFGLLSRQQLADRDDGEENSLSPMRKILVFECR
jgi:hypothetical protein